MSTMNMILIGVAVVLAIGGTFAFFYYKKRTLDQLFTQISMTSKQVPIKKRNSFVLMMLREATDPANRKKKSQANMNKLNNPKYLNVQMIQMTKILNDRDNVKDKRTKRALKLYDGYMAWEKDLRSSEKKKSE